MKRPLAIVGVLLAAVALAAVTGSGASGRIGGEFPMLLQLNGTPNRWVLPDGGRSGIWAASGQACADLAGSGAQAVMIITGTPTNLCFQPSTVNPLWDGGCNTIDTDQNFGVPVQAWVPQYVVLDPAAQYICGASDAGVVRAPIFRLY